MPLCLFLSVQSVKSVTNNLSVSFFLRALRGELFLSRQIPLGHFLNPQITIDHLIHLRTIRLIPENSLASCRLEHELLFTFIYQAERYIARQEMPMPTKASTRPLSSPLLCSITITEDIPSINPGIPQNAK